MIGNGVLANEESLSKDGEFVFNESVISNLQMQFEKVAAEVEMDVDVDGGSSFGSPHTPPHSPLPPQSVRVPPSTTLRGSALKKGVPAGPVREMPKKAKLRSGSAKKARKSPRLITPTIKQLKKLRPASA
ncbi:hypothetical protein GIB67_011987 [Kingdonia uniflora]|uniref:Uncharacterized protein n=1 Tax=Kingdonia uniflora TaxID=39325 RepID=A0A7J7M049_9MAGN|nr:hypothetical protein GIB67_011987 [Kingdonia uniflora]